jgi:hypothetical protein
LKRLNPAWGCPRIAEQFATWKAQSEYCSANANVKCVILLDRAMNKRTFLTEKPA